jgi:hypothetical protein
MFSESFEQAGPLITVWLQVRVLPGPPHRIIRQRSQTSVVIRRAIFFLILEAYLEVQTFADVRMLFANILSFCWHICWYVIDAESEIPTCH